MQRFFFHVFDNKAIFDPEGAELPNWQAAQAFAIRYMGELLQSNANLIAKYQDWHMNVTDSDGAVLMRLDFSLLRSDTLNSRNGLEDNSAGYAVTSIFCQPEALNDT
jgi:hypothetical protein